MKILFLSGHYPPRVKGGGELSTHYIAQGLLQRGHAVQVLCGGANERMTESIDGVPVVRVMWDLTAKPLFERQWAKRIAIHVAAELGQLGEFDVIHCHDFRTAQIVAMLNLSNAVVTVRDYAFICGSPNNLLANGEACPGCESLGAVLQNRAVVEAPLLRRPFRVWQYWYNIGFRKEVLQKFSRRVYISRAQQAIINEKVTEAGQERVIYNPVPSDYLNDVPSAPKRSGVLYVGTIDSYKGVGVLIEAFVKVRDREDVHLTLIGEGAGRRRYEHLVAQLKLNDRVRFLGRIEPRQLRENYDAAAIVVAPHVWAEPFGRSVVEAMARGCIVVAAERGGPAEIIKNDVTGILCAPGDVSALTTVLERALALPDEQARRMRQAAHDWCRDHLTIDTIAAQYEQFYEDADLV